MSHEGPEEPERPKFRPFTRESLQRFNAKIAELNARKSGQSENQQVGVTDEFYEDRQNYDNLAPNPYLEQNATLPRPLQRQFPPSLVATPVEEIDPYYEEVGISSFIVISKGREIFRFHASKSLYIFDPFHPLRRVAIYMLVHPWFTFLVIVTILLNCVVMTLKSTKFSDQTEIIFTTVYTFESCLKVIARGFIFTKFTYLRDPWNWLDFVVIFMAYLTMAIGETLGNLSALRTFRVLRALKTIAIIPGMKTIVGAVIESVKNLKDVIILTCFSLSVFALLGLQIYSGALTQICILNGPANMTNETWYAWNKNESNWIGYSSNEQANLCSNSSGGQKCPFKNTTCLAGFADNPNYGYTNFDSFNWALLCAFRLMNQDSWETLYQMILRATGPYHIVFFMAAIFLGSIYLVNLILAIVAMSYDDLQRKNAQEEQDANDEEAAYQESKKTQEQPEHCYDYNSNAGYDRISLENNSAYTGTLINPNTKHLQRTLSHNEADDSNHNLSERKNSLSLPGSPYQSEKLNESGGLSNGKEKQINGIDRYASVDNDIFRQNGANMVNHAAFNLHNTKSSIYNSTSSRISYSSHAGDLYTKAGSPLDPTGIKSLQNLHGYYTTKEMTTIDDYLLSLRQKRAVNPFVEKCPTKETMDSKKEDEEEENQEGALKKKMIDSCMKLLDTLCIWDCCWCWVRLQELFALIVFDPFMELFITLCIVVNTLFMAMDHHDMDPEFSYFLDAGNTFFTTTFAVEAFLKLIALSPKFYFREGWNIFDFLIVVLSLLEKAFEGISGFSVLRSFRLLRVFKLAKSWPTLNLLITIMGKALGSLANLTFVLSIIIFIFAVMGNQLFGKYYREENFRTKKVPRWNFTDFMHSFMIVFRVLCGEWIESMWDCMHAYGWQCVPFFLATVIIGNLVVLSLFLALLLSSFGASNLSAPTSDSADTKKLQEAFDRFARAHRWLKNRIISFFKPRNRISDQAMKNGLKIQRSMDEQGNHKPNLDTEVSTGAEMDPSGDVEDITLQKRPKLEDSALTVLSTIKVSKALKAQHEAKKNDFQNRALNFSMENISEEGERSVESQPHNGHNGRVAGTNMEIAIEDGINEYPADCFGDSFYKRFPCCLRETPFWAKWKEFRYKCYCLVENKYFETLVIILILLSSMTLALEDVHLKEKVWLQDSLQYIDKFFTVIFFFEMLLKWFAYGCKHYFTDAWCWLDFIIVMVSVLNFGAELVNMNKIQAFKTMRTLRALRPLRAMSRMQGMRVVVNALIQAIPAIFNVLLVCLIFWLIFAIMGVQFFNGKFAFCRHEGVMLNETDVPNSTVCKDLGYEWYNPPINFDHVPNAYLALFQVATWKGWLPIMDHAVDSRTRKGLQPIYEDNINMYLYFVFFIIFGAFFTLNLFIGVIIDNFNEQKKKTGGSMELFMTEEQKKYYNAMKKLGKKKPIKAIPRPRLKLQALLFDITTNKKFDMLIMVFIMLNMVVMCAEVYHAPPLYSMILERLNLFFIAIFTAECVLKIFALRWYYFKEPWNVFDFVIVILSIAGSILKEFIEKYFVSPTLLRVVRVVKIGRILRLVKGAKGIRTLLFALAMSLPALFNICLLLFLVMFIYAIFGMSFFMNVKKRASIDDTFNFGTFFKSFILLFQMCTSAGWDGVLDAIMDETDCNPGTPDEPGDCGNKSVAIPYIVSYLIITFLVIINMYIAVILENYSQAAEDVQEGLTDDDYDMYYEVWQKFDPQGTQFIHVSQLSDLFDALEEPLQIPKPNKYKIVDMEIPICVDDRVYCVEILDALTKNFFAKKGNPIEDTEELADVVPRRAELEVISNTKWRQRQEYCAKVIQRGWRKYLEEKAAAAATAGQSI